MINDLVGDNGSRFVVAAAAVALGLLCLVVVFWFMRNRPSSPFIRGGKNRQPRLAVLDAAAIDTRRRLVLVRRDDVEHLIMIGGPTDIVIESRITPQRPSQEAEGEPVQQIRAQSQEPRPVARTEQMPSLQAPAAAPQAATRSPQPQPQLQSPVSAVPASPVVASPSAVSSNASRPPAAESASASSVSGMGQVLYADIDDAPASLQKPTTRPAQPQPRGVIPTSGRNPEDILDAARSRVLTSPGTPTTSGTASMPSKPAPATPAAQDFERILDAEISNDLGRFDTGPREAGSTPAAATIRAVEPQRPTPRLDIPQPARREPSIEEEMNRMLGEMAATRKP